MNNKRILIWASSYAPVLGGLQRMLEQLAQEWQRQGHTVLVLTNKYPYQLLSNEIVDGVEVKRLIHYTAHGKGLKALLFKSLIPFQTKKITSLIKAFDPDKIYVQFPSAQLPYLEAVYKAMPNKQWYMCFHGHDILQHFEEDEQYSYTTIINSKGLQSLKNFLQNKSIALTACSQWLAKRVEQVFSQYCKPVYNAVDLNTFTQFGDRPINQPYIFAFGRLEHHKGFHLLINAYQKALLQIDSAPKLIIAGSGPYENYLKALVKSDFKDEIIFVGKIKPKDIANYGHYAESIWIPSLREPFGIAVLEALAMNANVYASNVGGIPEAGADYLFYFVPQETKIQYLLLESFKNQSKVHENLVIEQFDSFSVKSMANNYFI